MTRVKPESTWNQNKGFSEKTCPIIYVMNKIGGHWKSMILFYLMSGPKRYGELKKSMPAITEKMLAQHLKQLTADELIVRSVTRATPRIATYGLTESGEKLGPILMAMADWAMKNNQQFERLNEELPVMLSGKPPRLHASRVHGRDFPAKSTAM